MYRVIDQTELKTTNSVPVSCEIREYDMPISEVQEMLQESHYINKNGTTKVIDLKSL